MMRFGKRGLNLAANAAVTAATKVSSEVRRHYHLITPSDSFIFDVCNIFISVVQSYHLRFISVVIMSESK